MIWDNAPEPIVDRDDRDARRWRRSLYGAVALWIVIWVVLVLLWRLP